MRDFRRLWEAVHSLQEVRAEVRAFREALGSEGASLLLMDEHELRFCISEGLNSAQLEGHGHYTAAVVVPLSASRGINPIAALLGKTLCVQEMDARHNRDVDERLRQTTHSVLAVPLVAHGWTVGTLSTINPHAEAAPDAGRFQFLPEDVARAEAVAARLSQVLERTFPEGLR